MSVLMADLTTDDVRHVAKLARLQLTEEEIALFTKQFGPIMDAIGVLAEVDTDGVEPTRQVTGLENVLEADEEVPFVEEKADLLAGVDGEVIDNQVVVPSVF